MGYRLERAFNAINQSFGLDFSQVSHIIRVTAMVSTPKIETAVALNSLAGLFHSFEQFLPSYRNKSNYPGYGFATIPSPSYIIFRHLQQCESKFSTISSIV